MSWIEQLQRAIFRGVAFQVDGTEGSYGRRAVVHEYPLRDKPFVEDLGRKARGFVLEAFVIGPDYIAARDALANALEQPGAGRLVHPYLGERTVTVTEFKLRETTAEGGMARFSITCVEAGELTFPSAQLDTAAQVEMAADDAIAISEADFSDTFSLAGVSDFVSDAAGDLLNSALDAIEGLSGSLPSLPDAAAAFGEQLADARTGLNGLMQLPGGLASALTGLVSGLPGLVGVPDDALGLLRGLFDFADNAPTVPGTTPNRIQQAANQTAIRDLVQRAAVVEAARVASRVDFGGGNQTAVSAQVQRAAVVASAGTASQAKFVGYSDVAALRDELADQLDTLAESAQNDKVYESLVSVRAAMVRDITTRGADLARTMTITPQATQPALVLAYALYEDAGRDASIIARNKVRHPGFVPGGQSLEVLADA